VAARHGAADLDPRDRFIQRPYTNERLLRAISAKRRLQRPNWVSYSSAPSRPPTTSASRWLLIVPPKLMDTGNAGRDHVRCFRQQFILTDGTLADLHVPVEQK
jgi:hypothetical protein